MYRVFWYNRAGGEVVDHFDCLAKAVRRALAVMYAFVCIKDANGNIVYDGIDFNEKTNGYYFYCKRVAKEASE